MTKLPNAEFGAEENDDQQDEEESSIIAAKGATGFPASSALPTASRPKTREEGLSMRDGVFFGLVASRVSLLAFAER